MENNNDTPLQPKIDTSYLTPLKFQPELKAMNEQVKAKALPYASKQGGSSVAPPTFEDIQNLGVDKRLKGIDYSTQYSEMYAKLPYSGETVARYENFMPGVDNNELAAAKQTTSDKWVNGIEKAIAKTGSAVLGGTVGIVYGVGAAINDGSFSSIYDNSFSNTLADWDEKLQYQLPNYYTKQEQEKGLFGQMGTANFWADKFLGGLSFTAGAIISEGIWAYATGGLSLSQAGARFGTRIGRWGLESLGESAAIQGVTKHKSFYKTMLDNAIKAGKVSKTTANFLGKVGEITTSVGVLARSAGYEASVEALQFQREATENFFRNFASLNGREPNAEEIATFKDNLKSSANAVFGTNMGILMPSNLVTMGHILDIKSPFKTGLSDFIDRKAFGFGTQRVVDDAGKVTYKALEANTKQKVARTAYNYVLKPSLTEGLFEEGGQGVTTKAANKWIEHTYNPKHSNSNLDIVGDIYESLGEQYGTKEGWVENGLGMLIGIAGGSVNARSEIKQRQAEEEYKADVAQTFQGKNLQSIILPTRLQAANRIAGFSEEARAEAQKGNIANASLAQKSSLLTFINAKMIMGESISDMTSDIEMALESTTENQWKDAGIELDNIDSHKAEVLKDFKDLAQTWKSNKTYWGYMLGKKLVGEQNIDTETPTSTSELVESLAWQSTIGEAANKEMKEAQNVLAKELGIEYANTVSLNTRLKLQKKELRKDILLASRNYKVELARRDSLMDKIAKLNAAPKSPEAANKPAGKQLGALNNALLEVEQKISDLSLQLDSYAEQINQTESYRQQLGEVDLSSQDLSGDRILGSDLVSLTENLEKFGKILESLETTNNQRASYLNDILKEYSDFEKVFMQSQATQRVILNPDFKIENLNSWVKSKLKKNAPMNENTQEWLSDTLQSYRKAKLDSMEQQASATLAEEKKNRIEEIKDAMSSIADPLDPQLEVLQEELDRLEGKEAQIDKGEVVPKPAEKEKEESPTQVEVYKKRISEALKGSQNHLTYLGDNYDDVANKKPTQSEVDEFLELRDSKEFDSPRYQELQQKLSDWKLLDSAVDEDYVSLGDLILAVEQLEQEVEEEETVDEITPEDTPDIIEEESNSSVEGLTRYDILQNTNGSVTVKKRTDGKLSIHHLKLSSIANALGGEFTLKDKEGKSILFGQEQPGSVLTIRGVEFKLGGSTAIEVKEADFLPLQEDLNMYPLNTGSVNWTYSDMYTKIGDEFVKLESDFKDDTINAERIYDLKQGDKLVVTVSNDGYNEKLYKEYESAKGKAKEEALKRLKEGLKLNVTTASGIIENVSILKAMREEVDEQFLAIRDRAFDNFMAAEDKSNVKVGVEVFVDGIFLGSPRFTITDGRTSNTNITERGAKEVIATGYIQDGNVVINREVNNVNKTYVGKLSQRLKGKKIPIIIFKRGAYNIAYPVSMNKIDNNLSSLFDSILNMGVSNQEKIRRINLEIQNNRLETPKLVYEDINNNDKLESTREAFSNSKTFITADEFANKNYKIPNIINDASVNIDLENLDNIIADAKLRIKLDNTVRFIAERDLKYDNMIEVEDELNNVAEKLYRDYIQNSSSKYVDSKGNIIEDTGYTDTFDEFPIESPTSQLDKVKNINIIRKAFQGLTPSLKKIIGQEDVNLVESLIKRYDAAKSQIVPDKKDVKSGEKNSDCKE